MKKINSTEMMGVLEPEVLKVNHCDTHSTTSLTNYSTNNSQTLKNSESQSTLIYTRNDVSIIEERFQSLQEDYQKLLQQTQRKRDIFQKQRSQIEQHKANHLKNLKQIHRLQSLINIAKKTQIVSRQSNPQSLETYLISHRQKNSCSTPKNKKFPQKTKTIAQNIVILTLNDTNSGIRKVVRRKQNELQFSRCKLVPPVCFN